MSNALGGVPTDPAALQVWLDTPPTYEELQAYSVDILRRKLVLEEALRDIADVEICANSERSDPVCCAARRALVALEEAYE